MDVNELQRAIATMQYEMRKARVAYFDELVERGFTPRGACLIIYRMSGYL